jgi:CDP-glucose 4,6-dehydratase
VTNRQAAEARDQRRNPDPAFWAGKTVLITGHTGFKGTWLTLLLSGLGARVIGMSLDPPTQPNAFEICRAAELPQSDLRADITRRDELDRTLAPLRPEIVFHLAAQSNVRVSLADPVGTFAVNVMGTANLLDHFRRRKQERPRAIVCITSDKCYANDGSGYPMRETDPLGGHDPYSASKAGAELVVGAMAHSYADPQMRLATVRAGNVIGGGDFAPDRLIPDFVRARLADQPMRVRNPAATRPWQHVIEPLAGYLLLAEDLVSPDGSRFARPWNFGPDPSANQPVGTVVGLLERLWSGGPAVIAQEQNSVEAPLLMLDSSQARRRLGWAPRWDLETSLAATLDWYKAWRAGKAVLALMRDQIAAYTSDAAPHYQSDPR